MSKSNEEFLRSNFNKVLDLFTKSKVGNTISKLRQLEEIRGRELLS
jgi:hypothetical protein